MSTPLPVAPGTPDTVINQGLKLLQKRLLNYGGQMEDTQENASLLAAHMKAHGTDTSKVVYTAEEILDALWLGTCELFNRLKFNPLPQQLYMKLHEAHAQRLQARDDARRLKAEAENQKPFDIQARVGEAQKEKERQDQKVTDEKAAEQRNQIIHDYSVNANAPGRIDHQKSEEGRAYLQKIKITGRDGKFSEVLTLEAVSVCRWCDTVESMKRALDKWIDEINNGEQNERERKRQEERSGYVGARGR